MKTERRQELRSNDLARMLEESGEFLRKWSSYLIGGAAVVVVVIAFAAYRAKAAEQQLRDAWAGLGAAFGPGMVLSLWWRRTTKWGVFWGMVVGSATTVIWHNVPVLKDFVYELVPAFIFAAIAVVVGSLLTSPPAEVEL